MKTLTTVLFVGIVLMSHTAHADTERSGFTAEVGAGIGQFRSFQFQGDHVDEPALAPLSLGIGAFVSPRLAILARVSTILFVYSPVSYLGEASALEPEVVRVLHLGVAGQLWIHDELSVGAGIGINVLALGPIESRVDRGLGIPLSVGWKFAEVGAGVTSLVWELTPTIFQRGETALSSLLLIKWQVL